MSSPLSFMISTTTGTHVSIPLGIIIGLLASFIQSLGLTIQRKSHILNQALPEDKQRVEHRRPLWLLGFAVFISSNVVGSLVQIASLPVVILAPLGAVSLLWNAFFARFILGDVFSPWMLLGTVLIAAGAVMIGVYGVVKEVTRSLEDLLELFRRPAFIAYFSLLGAVVIVSLAITHVMEYSFARRLKEFQSPKPSHTPSPAHSAIYLPEDPLPLTTGATEALVNPLTERTPLLDNKATTPLSTLPSSLDRTRLGISISYASFSGILSGMCLIFAKSGVELLILTLNGENQFSRLEAWALVFGLVVFALLQLWYLHKALVLADPTLVCPSAFCFYNVSSIVNGLVYYNQISLITPLHLCLVTAGMIILLGGVWVVSIHSGGGGVDVGIWAGEDEENVVSDATEGNDPEVSSTSPRPLLDWGSRSEPDDHWRHSRRPETTAAASPTSTRTFPLPSTIVERHPSDIVQGRRISHHARHPTFDSSIGITRRRTSGSNIYGPLSPPPPGTVAAGFQIGLSPLSPGFLPMPRERRRRTSQLGGETEGSESFQHRRRTFSEGDMGEPVSFGSIPDVQPTEESARTNHKGGWQSWYKKVTGWMST